MARGRMITNDIARDRRINDLSSDTSRLAFTWLITFADAEGRTYGDPALVRSMLFPRRSDVSVEQVETFIREWAAAKLILWYEADGDWWICFPAFDKNQPNLRKDREPRSTIPAPECGSLPDDCRKSAGSLPDESPVKLSKEKLINAAEAANENPSEEPKEPRFPERDELQKHFMIKTGLPKPRSETKREAKAAQLAWWSPLQEILNMSQGDMDVGKELIDATVARMRAEKLIISEPRSIMKVLLAIYGERHSISIPARLEGYTSAE